MHLGLIGFGNIATTLLSLLEQEPVERITVLVRDASKERARAALDQSAAAQRIEVVGSVDALIADGPDLVVECAGQSAVATYCAGILRAGIPTVVASIGALADDGLASALKRAATDGGTQMILPAGAIGGIDLLAAVAPAGDLSVAYRGSKPPAAWIGTPAEDALDLANLGSAAVFFEGTARDAARSYPKNANVAATLALAGAGFDDTRVQLVADPGASGNMHSYEVRSPLCTYTIRIEGAASGANAKTSVTTVYSLLREINRRRHTVIV